ncbi:MAG: pilus assembly protein PilP [Desulfobacteraceae bacterium]|jgi:Tfp pilus assembly protein PilP
MPIRAARSSLLLLLIFVFLQVDTAVAAQEIVYKPARAPKKIVEAKNEMSGKAADKGQKRKEGEYSYDPTEKTDPFKSFIAIQEEVEEKKRRKPKTYLETLDLSQLELIAIVKGPKGNYAMVRDSKGLGHVIRQGTAIGTNGGVVDKIKEKEVVIREEYRDFRGTKKTREITKKIPSPM